MANILIVDDALFMRKMLGDILYKGAHRIVGEGENAQNAVALFEELHPDVLTLDMVMPEENDMNSIDAIHQIKAKNPDAKIIVVSAMGQQDIIDEAIEAGASDFIIKPFQKEDVINAVSKVMGH